MRHNWLMAVPMGLSFPDPMKFRPLMMACGQVGLAVVFWDAPFTGAAGLAHRSSPTGGAA